MSYEVLINLDEDHVGEVYAVRPPGYAWGRREKAAYGRWLIIEVDAPEDAEAVESLMGVWDDLEIPMPESDPEYDAENPGTVTVKVPRWRLRLSEFDGNALRSAWARGVASLTGAEFEDACESIQRRKFDPRAKGPRGSEAEMDGQGELWADSDQPRRFERPFVPTRAEKLAALESKRDATRREVPRQRPDAPERPVQRQRTEQEG